jgi:phage FluMu protein Com
MDEAKGGDSTQMQCMECGHKFKKRLGKNTFEVKCPKCKGYDTEPA